MADNVTLPAQGTGTSTPVIATDDVGGVQFQRVKVDIGGDGATSPVTAANPMPVTGTVALDSAALTALETITVASITAPIPAGTNNIGDVDIASIVPGTGATNLGKATDSAAGATDTGVAVLAVRDDALATLTPIEGDYVPLRVSSLGALHVTGGGGGTEVAEDTAHSSGVLGSVPLAVRRDANTSLVDVTNDYAPLQVDALGNLKVAIISGAGSGGTALQDNATFTPATTSFTPVGGEVDDTSTTATAEGQAGAVRMTPQRGMHVNLRTAAGVEGVIPGVGGTNLGKQRASSAGATDVGVTVLAMRQDTLSNDGSGAGDYYILKSDAFGRIHVNPQGPVAEGAAIGTSPPVQIGVRAQSTEPAVVDTGDVVKPLATLTGKQVVYPYALPGTEWHYAPPTGGLVTTGGVTAKTSAGAGVRNVVVSAQIQNSHQTISTEVEIRDGAAGTVLKRLWAQAGGGGISVEFKPPLRGTAATLIEIAEVTATATNGVLVNLDGYASAE